MIVQTGTDVFEKLMDWFAENKRDLPFRRQKDAYRILVSEVMAQQTQIATLLPYYERFVQAFPTPEALAAAPEEAVIKNWEGLGYYTRAKNLHKAAKAIVKEGMPKTYAGLLKLPGVGPYTAGAVASIAYNEKAAAVDGNVLRVISRIFGSTRDVADPALKKQIARELTAVMPEEAGAFNESLMELGALICTPKAPRCLICPVREDCVAYREHLTEKIPVKSKKQPKEEIEQDALIVLKDGKALYEKRPDGLLAGLYGFPLTEKGGAPALAANLSCAAPVFLGRSKHVFTHKIWRTDVYAAVCTEESSSLNNLTDTPGAVPKAFQKMADLLVKKP